MGGIRAHPAEAYAITAAVQHAMETGIVFTNGDEAFPYIMDGLDEWLRNTDEATRRLVDVDDCEVAIRQLLQEVDDCGNPMTGEGLSNSHFMFRLGWCASNLRDQAEALMKQHMADQIQRAIDAIDQRLREQSDEPDDLFGQLGL